MMRGMERRRAGVVKAATAIILAVAMGAPQAVVAQDAGANATAPPMFDGYSDGALWPPSVP